MSLLPTAYAASSHTAGHATSGGFLSMLPIFIIFIAIFYFLIIRPQSKRAKAHQKLVNDLTIGDEVMTAGGIVGKVAMLRDSYIVLTVAENVNIKFQRNSIAQILPKTGEVDNRTDTTEKD